MFRLILSIIIFGILTFSIWGSRSWCDCTDGHRGGVGNIGWKGIERISKSSDESRDHLLQVCSWVCHCKLPTVDLATGGLG